MLVPCATCQRHVSVDARTCPGCGAPTAKAGDRRAMWIVGLLALSLAVVVWWTYAYAMP